MMGTKAQELRAKIAALQVELDEIGSRERFIEARQLIGKCFKYRNCYSCPETDADYWWSYSRVLSVDEDGYASGVLFQIDKDGRAEIKQEISAWIVRNSGYVEITETEWREALRGFKAHVGSLSTMPVRPV